MTRRLEWFFLIFGLLAVDTYIWVNTNRVLYQAYQDWAFDETIRGLEPSVRGFMAEEIYGLFHRGAANPEIVEHPRAEANTSKETPEAPPSPASVIGRLQIPRLHLAVMVREGADEHVLRSAVGHIPGTALPGKMGNVALAGHRDTFFRPLSAIQKDDTIEVDTVNGTYKYVVQSTRIVGPRDVSVLAASGGRTLTLVTCYPFYYVGSAPKRFIVQAAFIGPVVAPTTSHGS